MSKILGGLQRLNRIHFRNMASENLKVPPYEPHTFLTQRRHPFHHFVNFVKFSSAGAFLLYCGQQAFEKMKGDEK